MTTQEYEKKLQSVLSSLDPKLLNYPERDFEETEAMYKSVEAYARQHCLINASIALPLVRGIILSAPMNGIIFKKDANQYTAYYNHSVVVAHSLIDLAVPITNEETDLALAAALTHIVIELIELNDYPQIRKAMVNLDARVFNIVLLITRNDPLTDEQQKIFYERIQTNKLAILVRLADRGNLVARLHTFSIWSAQEYVQETRVYFFPLCVYAKEHYPELDNIVSVLMGKMRYMIEVTDILANRFHSHETELTNEIMTLKEENARFRVMIRKLQTPENE